MSEIHIGPHTHEDTPAHAQAHGDHGHTYDREINLKAIGKWMAGLLVLTVIVEVAMWWMIRGVERLDARKDSGLTPIEQEMKQPLPPAPRLQVGRNFEKLNPEAETRSDLEDMEALRAAEDTVLETPAWQDQAQRRLRVPIDVAMQVIASRGPEVVSGAAAAAGSVTPDQMRQQLPAGTSTGAPGATQQMARPQTPAPPPAPEEQ